MTKIEQIKSYLERLPAYESDETLVPWVVESLFDQAEVLAKKDVNYVVSTYRPVVNYASNR